MAASISWPSMLSGIGSPSRYWIVGAMSSIDANSPPGAADGPDSATMPSWRWLPT